jgi:hypothetical protein
MEVGEKEKSRNPERRGRTTREMRNRVGGSGFWEGLNFHYCRQEKSVCWLEKGIRREVF